MNKQITFFVKNLHTMERLGVMQISAHAQLQGWKTDLIVTDDYKYASILQKVELSGSDILAFTAMSTEYAALEKVASRLKEDTQSFVLFGGPHATFCPDIIERPFVDAVTVGEGDVSFPIFLTKFEAAEDFVDTAGMHFRRNDEVIRNQHAPLLDDLDRLPFPDRSVMIRGNSLMGKNRSHLFMASRGCPFLCTYCFNHTYNLLFKESGEMYRRRTVDNLIDEIEEVQAELGTEFAYIDDDIFTLCTMEWLEEFAQKYPKRIKVPFMCNVHVNVADEEKMRLLKKAGCGFICFGLECGEPEVSRSVLKRWIKPEEILEVGALLHELGIPFVTQNLNGLPVPNPLEVDLKTLDLNLRLKPAYAIAHIFYPLPGTELETYAREHGYLDPDPNNMPVRTNSYSALTFPSKTESNRVQRLQKLFGLTVSFPFIRPLVPFLTRLPLTPVYSLVFIVWYGFTMRFRLERTKKSAGEILFYFKSLLRAFSSFLRPLQRKDSYSARYQ